MFEYSLSGDAKEDLRRIYEYGFIEFGLNAVVLSTIPTSH